MSLIEHGVFLVSMAVVGPMHIVLRIIQRTSFLSLALTMVICERRRMGIRSSLDEIPDIDGIMLYQSLLRVFSRNGLTRLLQSSLTGHANVEAFSSTAEGTSSKPIT